MRSIDTLVVGGGLSGLAHAHALAKSGRDVLVLERGREPGGVARTIEQEGYLLEMGPNTVRPTVTLLGLAAELGLESEMLFADPRLPRFVEIADRLRRVPFGALTLAAMLRAAAEPLIRKATTSVEESTFDFVARRFGRGVATNLLEPFVSGIWAGDARRLSAEAALPKLVLLERRYGSVLRGIIASRRKDRPPGGRPKGLLSFRRGLATLPRALASRLGERFRSGVDVVRIEFSGGRWRAETSAGDFAASRIVLATPAAAASRLAASVAPEAAKMLAGIPAPPVCVAHCAWPTGAIAHSLRGFGHLVAPRGGERVLGAVWSSSLFPGRAPEGKVLLTYFLGGRRNPDAAELDDSGIAAAVHDDAGHALGARTAPEILRATRHAAAIPQYEAGHAARLDALTAAERAHPGLKFLGNYRGGIAVGDVLDNAAIMAS